VRLENHFAEQSATRPARLRRAGFAIHGLNLLALASAAGAAGIMFSQALQIDREVDARDRQTSQLTDRYRSMIARTDPKQISSDTSRDTAALFKTHLQPVPEPISLLRDVSNTMLRFPAIRLEQLSWTSSNDDKANPALAPAPLRGAAPVKSETKATAQAPGAGTALPSDSANPPLPGNKYQILLLDVSISPFSGDYRKLIEDADRFVLALNGIPGIRASLHVAPLDVRSVSGIKASVSPSLPPPEEARFVVRVMRTMPPPDQGKS
jgi:hypothetical protein